MRRASQAWLLYTLCLLVIVPAMIWMSWQVITIDRAREESHRETELARQSAELQERISSALWRMDGMLMPLVAQEASRPHYVYSAFYQREAASRSAKPPVESNTGGPGKKKPSAYKGKTTPSKADRLDSLPPTPSPLLFRPSDYVILNFEAAENGQLRSPQVPHNQDWSVANALGCSTSMLTDNQRTLSRVEAFFKFDQVLAACPTVRLPNDPITTSDRLGDRGESDPNQSVFINGNQVKLEQRIQQQATANQRAEARSQEKPIQQAADVPATRESGRSDYGKISDWQRARNFNRGNSEFEKRSQTIQSQSLNFWSQNRKATPKTTSPFVREGVMKAIWAGDQLLLARRVHRDDSEVIQCCWLDWNRIQQSLATEVADLIPDAVLEPVRDNVGVRPELALAALPAQLSVDPQKLAAAVHPDGAESAPPASGLRLGLWVAWSSLAVAAIASAALLHGVLQLNERRSAFVSAVTHELRTPLTTFRMYAEMLAEGMVPSPTKQRQYAQTLKVEADRLAHLVENVLQFARLERGNPNDLKETTSVDELFSRFEERLRERAAQANMTIVLNLSQNLREDTIETTPPAFEQIVFNLVDNACKYAREADVSRIEIGGQRQGNLFHFTVRDHGAGVAIDKRPQLFKAFRKSDQDSANTAQGVGLGLALCRRIATALGGSLELTETTPGAEFLLTLPGKG